MEPCKSLTKGTLVEPATIETVYGIVKTLGAVGVVFVIWILTLGFFREILNQQKEMFSDMVREQKELFGNMVSEQSARNNENFQVLNKFAVAIEFTGSELSSLGSDVKNNRFCPVVRDQNREPPAIHSRQG
jgi:hypothetical protein